MLTAALATPEESVIFYADHGVGGGGGGGGGMLTFMLR